MSAEGYPAAAALDERLGDPAASGNPFGFAAMGRRDDREALTALAGDVGTELRLAFVPRDLGGVLRTADDTLMLARLASRRDATVMPATMFGITATTAILLAGTAEQRAEIVELARGGRSVGFALTEVEHDNDLLANQCALTGDGAGGYLLAGRKWRVGLGPRCEALVVFARTGGRGPAAFSLVLLRAAALQASRQPAGRRTDGMRGVDFADFCFDDVAVPAADVVGHVGQGLETTLRAMQFVRVMSTAANLGSADTALRLTLDHVVDSTEDGRPLAESPAVRRALGTAAAALAAADVIALSCARSLHTRPALAGLWSSTTKAVVAELSQEVFARCSDVLGFRSVLLDGPSAAFAVAQRDTTVVRYIDTDPVSNLRLVAQQLRRIASERAGGAGGATAAEPGPELAAAFDLDAPLPPFRPDGLALSWRGGDEVTDALPAVVRRISELGGPTAEALASRLEFLRAALDLLYRDVHELGLRLGRDAGRSAEVLDRAEQFAFLHAAAGCVHLWWFNRGRSLFGTAPGSVGWLVAALDLLHDRSGGPHIRLDPEVAEAPFAMAVALHAERKLFSSVALTTARAPKPATDTEPATDTHSTRAGTTR